MMSPLIGDKAIDEIKTPALAKTEQEKLAEILAVGAGRFTEEHIDAGLWRAVLGKLDF